MYNKLLIKNGMLFKSDIGIFEKGDLSIEDGKIVSELNDKSEVYEIDANGKLVLPGLIDEHVHLNYRNTNIGVNADLLCLPMGVTSAVDPGSTGWCNFDGLYDYIQRCLVDIYAYLHVAPYGVCALSGQPEYADPKVFNRNEILHKVLDYPDTIKGLKLRMNNATLRDLGISPLEETMKIAEMLEKETHRHFPVEVHFDNLPQNVKIADILSILRPGDIFLHIMQAKGETIFDEEGCIKQEVINAQKRGILMDDSHGRMLWSFEHLHNAVLNGFKPDIISSDVVHRCEYIPPASCLLYAMNVDMAAGMNYIDILRAVTYKPAKALNLTDKIGTLNIGSQADVCIMDIADHETIYKDWWNKTCKGEKVFVPLMTIKKGEVVYRQTFF